MSAQDDWVPAKHARRPLQTKLISSNYQNIALPKRAFSRASPLTVLKDIPLSAFGFLRERLSPGRKRKRSSVAVIAPEVKDSQADSDDESLCVGSHEATDLSSAFEKLASPSKRQRFIDTEDLPSPPCSRDGGETSSPIQAWTSRMLFTPTSARRNGDHPKETLQQTNEVPSSVSHERYNFRPLDAPDTPISKLKLCMLQHQTSLVSPPPSSAPRAEVEPQFYDSSPFRGLLTPLLDTSARDEVRRAPISLSASQSESLEYCRRYSPIHVLSDEPSEIDVEVGDKENWRPPFEELPATLVPTSQTRARRRTQSIEEGGERMRTPSASRSEPSPVWHDALESPSNLGYVSARDQSPTPRRSVSPSPLRSLPRMNTVEDSQFEEALDPLSPMTQRRAGIVNRSSSESPRSHHNHSWQPNDSLLNTLLPPGFHPSQYDMTTQPFSSSPNTCPAPPHCETQALESPLRSNKRKADRPADPMVEGKRQKNFEFEDAVSDDIDAPGWIASPSAPRRTEGSSTFDESLTNTTRPPLFSLPSTADES